MVNKLTLPAKANDVQSKVNELVDDKQDTLVSGTNIKTINNTSILGSGNIDIQGGETYTAGDGIDITNGVISVDGETTSEVTLATVATSGDYEDLSNKPTIPTVNNATLTIQKNSTNVATFTANASSNVTANISVPTKVSDLTNDSGFISSITSLDVTTALGYTPYNSTNPSGYQANVIETVKVNGTALTPSSKAVDVTVPTKVSQLTNDSGYTTNTGTVTSVNNVSPVSGNVTLSIPTITDTYSATSSDGMSGKAVASAISGKADSSALSDYVPTTRTVNSKALSADITLTASDVGALPSSTVIPTVNDATLTITQGGVSKGTFTANASSNVTIALDAGTEVEAYTASEVQTIWDGVS